MVFHWLYSLSWQGTWREPRDQALRRLRQEEHRAQGINNSCQEGRKGKGKKGRTDRWTLASFPPESTAQGDGALCVLVLETRKTRV